MKKLLLFVVCCTVSFVFWAGNSFAGAGPAYHCVTTAGELQSALITAATNSQDDIIRVVQGTYSGHFTFSSSEGKSIALYGGYTAAGCVSQVVDPSNTILDGGGTGQVLNLYNSNGGYIAVDGFTIRDGNSSTGSGVYAYTYSASGTAGNITLTNNTISGNTAASGGGGGGVNVTSGSTSGVAGNITLENNTISGNTATNNWGGGGVISSSSSTGTAGTITFTNNTISGNTVTGNYGGGGLYIDSYSYVGTAGAGALIFTSNTISGNTSSAGGGVYASTSSDSGTAGTFTFTNNIIAGNSVTSGSGGGVYAYSNSTAGTGGTVTFTNNTITGNAASSAGGILLYKYGNIINFYNNIVWGNTASNGGDIYLSGSTGTTNGYNNDYNEIYSDWDNKGGNIYSNPLFVDASVHNYHLSSTSPCIDAGNNSAPGLPSTDIDGDTRIINGTVDMGADEYLCSNNQFKIGGTIYSYASIHAAYEAMTSGDTMQIHTSEYSEALALDLDKIVTLKGGYNCDFTSNTGYTTISGSLTISNGTVTIENITVK